MVLSKMAGRGGSGQGGAGREGCGDNTVAVAAEEAKLEATEPG